MSSEDARKAVIQSLIRRKSNRDCLFESTVRKESPDLHRACIDYFGSWEVALKSAGVRPPAARHPPGEGVDGVLRAIRYLCHSGQSLKTSKVRSAHHALYSSAVSHFGSWINALAASGINVTQVDSALGWDRDRIIEALLIRAVERRPLGSTTVRPRSLKRAAVKEFGSWSTALQAAGLNPKDHIHKRTTHCQEEPNPRDWDEQRVLKQIRQRELLGMPLDKNSVSRDHRPLVRAAKAYFGGWWEALAIALDRSPDERPEADTSMTG